MKALARPASILVLATVVALGGALSNPHLGLASGGTWRYLDQVNNTYIELTCDDSGSCVGRGPWKGEETGPGNLTMTFSGTSVSLRGVILDIKITGSGQANAPWPHATTAGGFYDTNNVGARLPWSAARTLAADIPSPTKSGPHGGPPVGASQSTAVTSGGLSAGDPVPFSLPTFPPSDIAKVRTIAGGGTRTILVGTDLADNVGAKFATDSFTTAHIVFRDRTTLDIGPNSSIEISPNGSPVLAWFESGILHFKDYLKCAVEELNPTKSCTRFLGIRNRSRYNLGGVRGTEFTVDYSGANGDPVVRVIDGRVDVEDGVDRSTVSVTAGHAVEIGYGDIKIARSVFFPWWLLPDDRVLIAIAAVVYLFPLVLALLFQRRGLWKVAMVDLLLGWTVVGWVVSFVLVFRNAASSEVRPREEDPRQSKLSNPDWGIRTWQPTRWAWPIHYLATGYWAVLAAANVIVPIALRGRLISIYQASCFQCDSATAGAITFADKVVAVGIDWAIVCIVMAMLSLVPWRVTFYLQICTAVAIPVAEFLSDPNAHSLSLPVQELNTFYLLATMFGAVVTAFLVGTRILMGPWGHVKLGPPTRTRRKTPPRAIV